MACSPQFPQAALENQQADHPPGRRVEQGAAAIEFGVNLLEPAQQKAMAKPQARRQCEGIRGRAIGEGHHPASCAQRGDRLQQLLGFRRFQQAGHRQLQQLGCGVGLALGKEQQKRSWLPPAAQLP